MIAPYLTFSVVNLFTPETLSLFRLKKDLNSNRLNIFLINGGKAVTLYSNMLNFRDGNKSFRLDGDLLKEMMSCNFHADHSSPQG